MIGIKYYYNDLAKIVVFNYKTFIGVFNYLMYDDLNIHIIDIKDLSLRGTNKCPIIIKSIKKTYEDMLVEGIFKIYFSKIK